MVNTKIKLITLFVAEDGRAVYRQQKKKKKRPGADYGSDHQLLIAKSRLKLKKMGEITRPARHHQIPIEYAVEVMNRPKGLDLVNSVLEELWTEVRNIVQGSEQNHPKEKEKWKGKVVAWGGFTSS